MEKNPFEERSLELVKEVYRLLKYFPDVERYALADQLRRSVTAIGSNFAEGRAKIRNTEFLPFLATARGSVEEVKYQLKCAVVAGYITEKDITKAISLCEECYAMITATIRTVYKKIKDGQNEYI